MRKKGQLRRTAEPPRAGSRHSTVSSARPWGLGIVGICCLVGGGILVQRSGILGLLGQPGRSGGHRDRSSQSTLPPFVSSDPAFRPVEVSSQELIRGATDEVRRLAERFPNDPAAMDGLARFQYHFGNSAEAVDAWQRCLKLDATFVSAHEGLGQVAAARDDYKEAADHFRKAIELSSGSPRTPIDLAHALMNQGKFREVIALLEGENGTGPVGRNGSEGTSHQPTPPLPSSRSMPRFLLLGQAYQQLGRHEKAKQNFETAVELAPDYPSGHYGLAMTCAELGLKDEAKKHLEAFRRLEAADRQSRTRAETQADDELSVRRTLAQACTDAGRVWARHHQEEEAEVLWRKAAALDAEQIACREDLAAFYEQNDREEESLLVCQELLKIAPANADYALNVGLLSARLNRLADARAAVQRAIELDPRNPRYHEVYRMIEKGH